MLVGLALRVPGVCLLNTVGLLLAKFLKPRRLTGVRRALGASRRRGVPAAPDRGRRDRLAGGVLGLALGALLLAGLRALYAQEGGGGYQALAACRRRQRARRARPRARRRRSRRPVPGLAHRPHCRPPSTSRASDRRSHAMNLNPVPSPRCGATATGAHARRAADRDRARRARQRRVRRQAARRQVGARSGHRRDEHRST